MYQAILLEIYELLLKKFGRQNWWPAETTFEMIIGAILTQCTNWTNVEKAINNLKDSNLLNLEAISKADEKKIAELIKPSGYFNQKTKKIRAFVNYVNSRWNGNLNAFLEQPLTELRNELLSIYGIGPETADSIILYGANKPIFVIDRYTHRFLNRHGLCSNKYDYHKLQKLFTTSLEPDVELFKEYHALIVCLGKNLCKKKPLCEDCPLQNLSKKEGEGYGQARKNFGAY